MPVETYDDFGAPADNGPLLVELAKAGYDAYGGHTDWKNFAGNPMPTWDQLPERIQGAWLAHTKRVVTLLAERKIKRFSDDATLSWEERFRRLEAHHIAETTALVARSLK